MKTFLVALATLLFTVTFMVACSSPQVAESDSGNGGFYQDTWHKMPDGRTVYCLYKERHSGNGFGNTMACDFAGATVHTP